MPQSNQPLSKVESRNKQRSLNHRITHWVENKKIPRDLLRFKVVFDAFLQRVFQDHPDGMRWVLKGGTSILMRNSFGRTTTDLDLARIEKWESTDEIVRDFQRIAERAGDDPFSFTVKRAKTKHLGDAEGYRSEVVEVAVDAYIGTLPFQSFTIDVSQYRHTQDPFDEVEVMPLLGELLGKETAPFTVYATAVESQIADKICAMSEMYRGGPSTRYHDLADLVMIIRTLDFDAALLVEKLQHEAARRGITAPSRVEPPASWEGSYERNAPGFYLLPERFHDLPAATVFVGKCLDPVLGGAVENGRWNHTTESWNLNQ